MSPFSAARFNSSREEGGVMTFQLALLGRSFTAAGSFVLLVATAFCRLSLLICVDEDDMMLLCVFCDGETKHISNQPEGGAPLHPPSDIK